MWGLNMPSTAHYGYDDWLLKGIARFLNVWGLWWDGGITFVF